MITNLLIDGVRGGQNALRNLRSSNNRLHWNCFGLHRNHSATSGNCTCNWSRRVGNHRHAMGWNSTKFTFLPGNLVNRVRNRERLVDVCRTKRSWSWESLVAISTRARRLNRFAGQAWIAKHKEVCRENSLGSLIQKEITSRGCHSWHWKIFETTVRTRNCPEHQMVIQLCTQPQNSYLKFALDKTINRNRLCNANIVPRRLNELPIRQPIGLLRAVPLNATHLNWIREENVSQLGISIPRVQLFDLRVFALKLVVDPLDEIFSRHVDGWSSSNIQNCRALHHLSEFWKSQWMSWQKSHWVWATTRTF